MFYKIKNRKREIELITEYLQIPYLKKKSKPNIINFKK